MATLTQIIATCDVCGDTESVRTWTFGLDDKAYEIDLCPKDGKGLSELADGYIPNARKSGDRRGTRNNGHKQRPKRSEPDAVAARGGKAKESGARDDVAVGRPKPQKAQAASGPAAGSAGVPKRKGIYVYGILPADIEVTADMPGIGKHPGQLRAVRKAGLAALISEVDLTGRVGSPADRRAHRRILNATATEVPVLPVRFGTVLSSTEAVAEELLAAHHDAFADALAELGDRTQFVVKGHYAEDAILSEIRSENGQSEGQDRLHGSEPGAGQDTKAGLGESVSEAAAARRKADKRALRKAMEGVCVASAARKPIHELDAVNIAFLVAADQVDRVEQVVNDLAEEWAGRIELRLLGPMAAYDFMTVSGPG